MEIKAEDVIVWVVVGALAGSFVGVLATRSREGFGRFYNLGIGMAGAFIGGLIFKAFDINLGLRDIKFSAEDLATAVIGALILLVAMWLFRVTRRKKE